MKYLVVAEIQPSYLFGVPEKGKVVYPAMESANFVGNLIDAGALLPIQHGTLSKYRRDDESIDLMLDLGDAKGRIKDNYIHLNLESESPIAAYRAASHVIDLFLQHLSVSNGCVFAFSVVLVKSEDGDRSQFPKTIEALSAGFYAIDRLRENILDAQQYIALKDARLDKALRYFEHAMLLFEKRSILSAPRSRQYRYVITAVFLNLWKSVSVIVGDPSRRKDGYQKRYKVIGLDDNYKVRIDKLKNLRDDFDVAHYDLDEKSLDDLEEGFTEARDIAIDILRKYREHIVRAQA